MFSDNDYRTSIEESASYICQEGRADLVKGVLQAHHVRSIDELNPSALPEVFSELYAYETDLRD